MNETQRFSSTQLQVLLDIMGKNASLDDILNAFGQSTPEAVDTVLPTLDFFILRALANTNSAQNAYLLDHLAHMENLPNIARNVPLAVQTIRLLVAQNSLTSQKTLARLAEDANWEVRRGVAKNKKTPAVVLTRLAEDTEYPVLRNVAGHANVPEELLPVLAKDLLSYSPREIDYAELPGPVERIAMRIKSGVVVISALPGDTGGVPFV